MTIAYDGFHSVACGKLKKVLWKTTPYDQPAIAITNSNPKNTSKSGFLSRLIYALTCAFWKCAFWKRNLEAPVTGTNEEQRNLANTSAATEISNLQTITRYEIEHLKTFLHSRTTTSDVGEGDKGNISNNSHALGLKALTSGPLNKHAVKGIKQISIPKAFEEDVASPVELAKARSCGRTAMNRMARSPYYGGPSTLSKKPTPSLISSQPAWELEGSNGSKMAGKNRSSVLYDHGFGGLMPRIRQKAILHPTQSHISSQPAWELEGSNGSNMAGKHRSSVLYDFRSGSLIRRIRQKADLYSQGSSLSKHKSEFVSSAQRLLLCSEPKQKASNAFHTTTSDVCERDKENFSNNSHALRLKASTNGPLKKRAVKGIKRILIPRAIEEDVEHLERTSLKGKHSSSRLAGKTEKSATKLTSNLAHGSLDKVESSNFLLSSQSNQKSEGKHRIEENGPQRFAAPLIVLSSMNGNSTTPVQGNAPTTNSTSTLALPAEPPKKKLAFQMSVPEDFEVLDDDNHSTAPIQGNAPTTNAASTLAWLAEPPQKKPAFQMSVPEDFEELDDDNHSTAPIQGNAPTRNDASTLALTAVLPQKKTVFQDFEVLDDDNHSTVPIQGNAPNTNAASILALTTEPPQKKHAFQDFEVLDDDSHSTNAPISLEYDDPPQKKLRLRFSYNQ